MYETACFRKIVAILRNWFFHIVLIFMCAFREGVQGPAHAAVVDGTS
jgi:hypothetical protein